MGRRTEVADSTLTVQGHHVALADGLTDAALHVEDGRITAITAYGDTRGDVLDADVHLVLPGLVDPHVHVNEPGRSDWEGFRSATRAALLGGTTTIVDMPLNCLPPTTTADHLATKAAAAEGRIAADVAFWGGIVPDNRGEVADLVRTGVRGAKAFLIDSGVDEFPPVDRDRLRDAMLVLREADLPTLVHAELAEPMATAQRRYHDLPPDHRRRYAAYVDSRPAAAEVEAVRLVAELVAETGAPAHIVHLSAAAALPLLRDAHASGLPLTAETCPHYLVLAAEDVPDGDAAFKCAPPIRDRDNAEALWEALADGTIGMVASDHSPCPPDLKASDDLLRAWGGIASLQLRLPLVWTAARARDVPVSTIAHWLATAPARLARLRGRGVLQVGARADLVVFDQDATWTVDPERLEHRHPVSPYAGREVTGRVRHVLLGGRHVVDEGEIVDDRAGHVLLADDR